MGGDLGTIVLEKTPRSAEWDMTTSDIGEAEEAINKYESIPVGQGKFREIMTLPLNICAGNTYSQRQERERENNKEEEEEEKRIKHSDQ